MDKKYNIDLNIPGWLAEDVLRYLAKHVSTLPENSTILEIGALFGRATYVLGHNKPKSAKLITIEPWISLHESWFPDGRMYDKRFSSLKNRALIKNYIKDGILDAEDFFNLWKHFSGPIENLESIKGYSPLEIGYNEFDFIYHDGSHSYEDVYKDLCFWFPKLKENSVMIVDDYYESHFPGVVKAVNQYVNEHDLEIEMITRADVIIRRKS